MTAYTTLTVDLNALRANYRFLKSHVGAGVQVAGVIKADGYGLGAVSVARTLDDEQCPQFFVATLDEGIAVRAATQTPIAVFGGVVTREGVEVCRQYNLTPVVNSPAQLDLIAEMAPGMGVMLHLDTGMNRLGFSGDEVEVLAEDPSVLSRVNVRLILSHFACSDELSHAMNTAQYTAFDARLKKLRAVIGQDIPGSLANSSGILRDVAYHYQMVRPGFALYGGNPTPETDNLMQGAVRLDTTILQVRDGAAAGETVGYGATYTLTRPTRIATIGCGYADGFMRAASNRGVVYYNGHPCPIVGRVSMDFISVDVTDVPGPAPQMGNMVELIGPHVSVDTVAASFGTIGYEVLTQLSKRAARNYIK